MSDLGQDERQAKGSPLSECYDPQTSASFHQQMTLGSLMLPSLHSENEKYFEAPFSVLQLITNRGLVLVPGRTK